LWAVLFQVVIYFAVTTKEIPKRELRDLLIRGFLTRSRRFAVTTKEIPKRELRFISVNYILGWRLGEVELQQKKSQKGN